MVLRACACVYAEKGEIGQMRNKGKERWLQVFTTTTKHGNPLNPAAQTILGGGGDYVHPHHRLHSNILTCGAF